MSILQPDEALYSLLCKYLLNEADTVERQWVDSWRQQHPANEETLSAIRKMLEVPLPEVAYPGLDTESSWQRLKMQIQPPFRQRYLWMKIAAVLVLALGVTLWFTLWQASPQEQTFAGAQQAKLPDGSHVAMEGNAQLKLLKGFDRSGRTVHFSGKAVFDIAQNAEHPFVIVMGHTEVKVLGTRFLVDYHPEDSSLTVHVTSGKIMVTDLRQGDSVVLSQGMLLHSGHQQPFVVADYVKDITRRQLVFNNVPLQKVLQTVEAVYGVKVEVTDSIVLQKAVTANFENETIDNVLASIAFMTNTETSAAGPQRYTIH